MVKTECQTKARNLAHLLLVKSNLLHFAYILYWSKSLAILLRCTLLKLVVRVQYTKL